jgi:flavin reductase (DIM6/NTAB) family NADH-FMN oxidoreductase RutF
MFYDTQTNDHGLRYNPFKSCVIPRPIGWISTISYDGIPNLAPFSTFNQLAYDPPFVFFSGSSRPGTAIRKDSVVNAEETGEFVVNMATWEMREHVNRSSTGFPPEVDEMALLGLTKLPSRFVKPWRVGESPIHLECRYHQTITLPGNRPESIHRVVIGAVIGIHIDDKVLTSDGRIDVLKIRPLARLGYMDYTSVTELFSMPPDAGEAGLIGEAVANRRQATTRAAGSKHAGTRTP